MHSIAKGVVLHSTEHYVDISRGISGLQTRALSVCNSNLSATIYRIALLGFLPTPKNQSQ